MKRRHRLRRVLDSTKIVDRNLSPARIESVVARYGIDAEVYVALLERQGAACAICGKSAVMSGRALLCVDHDHVTGRVRGLLCGNCNSGLGMFGETSELLRLAAAYLDRN